ncbi:MAG: TIGR03621 family F420-dependent LLM class oxidoreductase [Candidatus Limnocylindria bacterium]
MTRDFRFAVTATRASSAAEWRAKAQRAEALGYDVLLVTDHLSPQLAAVPALMAAADATTTLRVGSFVFANDYRNPVMLAKEAATIDVLSGGRLEFGLGAGWSTPDYEMLGIPYDAPKVRVARFAEALRIVKRCWDEDTVDHTGPHYTVRGTRVLPKPLQRPRPPVMVGGGGPIVLRLASREADIVALAPQVDHEGKPHLGQLTLGATAEKVRQIREAAGARFGELELNVIVFDAAVTDEPLSALASVAGRLKAAAAALVESPYFLFGSAATLRRQLLERRDRFGLSYYAIPEKAMEQIAPLARELRAK